MSEKSIMLCGLPESGKTTFIAALWYLLTNEEIATALSLGNLPESRSYLNNLSRVWSRILQVERTPTDEFQEISISLKNGTSSLSLNVPDMSGETWRALWAERTCSDQVKQWAQSSTGIMLFLHSDKINQPLDIISNNEMIRAMGEEPKDVDFVSWSTESTPTQVILVDLLQSLALPPLGDKTRRLAVILSAWDKTADTGMKPEEYLRTHLPLLNQFLLSSGYFSEIKIYGISAQGGDFESPEDLEKLRAENTPSKRIKVVDEESTTHDLTLPIQWLVYDER